MDVKAMEPQGLALLAFFDGDVDAELVIHRDDGVNDTMRISHFFRDSSEFTEVERVAMSFCTGHVLDVGAGTGLHSLVLQQQGLAVTAIDIAPQAVTIMTRRGIKDARCADILTLHDGPFDTILLMGHGIGMVETIAGLDRFLEHAHALVPAHGQLLLDSQDVRLTDNASHLAYHEANRRADRYVGEVRLQLGFRGQKGSPCGWLHVDPETLQERASSAAWRAEVILREETGHYLAKLTKARDA